MTGNKSHLDCKDTFESIGDSTSIGNKAGNVGRLMDDDQIRSLIATNNNVIAVDGLQDRVVHHVDAPHFELK